MQLFSSQSIAIGRNRLYSSPIEQHHMTGRQGNEMEHFKVIPHCEQCNSRHEKDGECFAKATAEANALHEAMQHAKRNHGAGSFAHKKATAEWREGCRNRERIGFASGNMQSI